MKKRSSKMKLKQQDMLIWIRSKKKHLLKMPLHKNKPNSRRRNPVPQPLLQQLQVAKGSSTHRSLKKTHTKRLVHTLTPKRMVTSRSKSKKPPTRERKRPKRKRTKLRPRERRTSKKPLTEVILIKLL